MTPQKLVVLFTSLTGGAIGLLAPIGVVKWLLQTEPEDAGILTLFFFPVWCLLFALGLLIGRRLGLFMTGGIGSGLNPENPNRNDGSKHGEARNRPAGRVNRTIRFGPVHHGIVPVGHNSLLEIASGRLSLRQRLKVQTE